jgi:ABC-type phosphate/phosphonate transport system permease subunit
MMSAPGEIWHVSTVEGVFEADLETLKQWIVEGCVLPTDKVSKGSLNWIEAGRAPMLRSAFNSEVQADFPAVSASGAPDVTLPFSPDLSSQSDNVVVAPPNSASAPSSEHVCHNHPQRATKYICRGCAKTFCEECPRFVGTSKVALCSGCGDLCKLLEQVQSRAARQEFQSSGFGFADFARALRYPLQHKIALLSGAGIYGFLLLGGFRGRIVASVIMFGCISHVISQVAWGRLNRSFMPDFSAFSLWDDVAVPIALGIGITIVTWGPTIALLLALIFGVLSGSALSPSSMALAPADESARQAESDLSTLTDPNADPKKLEEANKTLEQLRPGHQISQEAERSKKELSDPTADLRLFASYFQASVVIVILLLLSLGWGIFYYPMALAVAGYTQSLGSVINPLVGLDTIRRMRGTYFKAFGMVLLIQVVGFIVAVIVAMITAPFTLPFFGNLPAMFIDGSLTFYFNLVVACVLGLSLHKCADRLGIDAV